VPNSAAISSNATNASLNGTPTTHAEIDIAPKLAGKISNGETTQTVGRKQTIPGEVDHFILIGQHADSALHNLVTQPQYVWIIDFARQFGA